MLAKYLPKLDAILELVKALKIAAHNQVKFKAEQKLKDTCNI